MKTGKSDQKSSKAHVALTSPSPGNSGLAWCRADILLSLLLVSMAAISQGVAADVALGWNPNTEPDLAGYVLYYGKASRQYDARIDVKNVTAYTVSGLADGTYYFALTAYDTLGDESAYSLEVPIVVAAADTRPPVISAIAAAGITCSSASISWATDEAADTQVEYGLSAAYGSVTPLDSTLTTTHKLSLNGLTSNTTYHYRVRSKDAAGNLSASGDLSFTTSVPPDSTPPAITNVGSVSISNNSATITWTTSELSNTQVEYGSSTSYGSLTTLDSTPVTSHSQVLTGLSSGTTYHFRVKSRDAAGNQAISSDNTFTTTSLPDIVSGLVAAYAFDEGVGSKAADASGSSNFATLNNAAWTTKARFGKALNFNGKNSYVSAGITGLPAVSAPKTISCWLSVNGGSGLNQAVIVLANEAQQASVQQGFKSTQVGMLQYGGAWLVAANPPASKMWHHFAYTFDGTQNRFYIDGVLVGTSTIKPQVASVASFQIGRWIAGSDYFKGSIDEVRIYNRPLNQEEIMAAMNTPVAGSSPGQPLAMAKLEVVDADSDSDGSNMSAGAEGGDPDRVPAFGAAALVAIDIRMSRRAYSPGETVSASACWISNPSARARDIELKAWATGPSLPPVCIWNREAIGSLTLPPGLDRDYGPVPLFEVSGDLMPGDYGLNARMLDPVTGEILAEDLNTFGIAADARARGHSRPGVQTHDDVPVLALQSDIGNPMAKGLGQLQGYRVSNDGAEPAAVELKVWLEGPGLTPVPLLSLGEDGSVILPAGSELRLDPLALSRPFEGLLAGAYSLKARVLNSVTGEVLSETADELVIR